MKRRSTITLVAIVLIAATSIYSCLKLETDGADFDRKFASPRREQIAIALVPEYVPEPRLVEVEPKVERPEPEGTDVLTTYVLGAMRDWNKGRVAGEHTHEPEIARACAVAALDSPKTWANSDGKLEALVLASVAFWETRYRDYVDAGLCNDDDWRKTKVGRETLTLGDCDGGRAVSVWQIQFPPRGIDLATGAAVLPNAAEPIAYVTRDTALGIKGRTNAARAAMALVRRSIRECGGTLNCYVGGFGPAREQKARERLGTAMAWYAKHPRP